jgi:hypothetical protein
MSKKEKDLRSKQMNPNNVLYYKSRMGNLNKSKPKPRPRRNMGFPCKLCGRAGKLKVGTHCSYPYTQFMRCGYCNGTWDL